MARAAIPGRLSWQVGTLAARTRETDRAHSLAFTCPEWAGHLPGQHIDLRLTAEDGYQAQRSYSIAAPADGATVTITVERIADGEVSPFLTDELRVGEPIELRGPIGGFFVWQPADGGPLLLIAGGSGIVPLMAMLRARVAAGGDTPVRLLASARSDEERIYRAELDAIAAGDPAADIRWTLTRSRPAGWKGYARRVDAEMLREVAWPAADRPRVFVCGPTGFVETVAATLVGLGHDPQSIRAERFGPSGG